MQNQENSLKKQKKGKTWKTNLEAPQPYPGGVPLPVSFIPMISLQTTRRLFFRRPKVSLLTSTPSRPRRFLFGNPAAQYKVKPIHTTLQGGEENKHFKKYVTQRLTASKDHGTSTKDQGPWTKDQGPRTKDQGPRTMNQGPRTKDQGPRTKDQGPRAMGHGPCWASWTLYWHERPF